MGCDDSPLLFRPTSLNCATDHLISSLLICRETGLGPRTWDTAWGALTCVLSLGRRQGKVAHGESWELRGEGTRTVRGVPFLLMLSQ